MDPTFDLEITSKATTLNKDHCIICRECSSEDNLIENATLVSKLVDLTKQHYTMKTKKYTSLHRRITASSSDVIN